MVWVNNIEVGGHTGYTEPFALDITSALRPGLNTVAVVVGEEPETIEDVYEPFLIQSGFLKRTSRGREVTEKTYRYFNIDRKNRAPAQVNLF